VASGFLAFVAALAAFWAGLPLLGPIYLVLGLIAVQEYAAMMRLRGIRIHRRSLWVATVLTLPASLPLSYPGMPELAPGVGWRELALGVFATYLIVLEVMWPRRESIQIVACTLLGYVYIPWFFGYLLTLRYTPDGVLGLWYLTLTVLAVIASDVGGYVFGSLFGRRPLAPYISPNKTLEGAVGGLLLAVVVVGASVVGLDRFLQLRIELYHVILFPLLVALAAQLGDLFESMLKRWAGVKDTGIFLPGHGGVLDRLDSVLFALPVTYWFVTVLILR
jgi:phosphatidate cytidylyltransferase